MSPADVTKTIIGRSVNSTGATDHFLEVNGVSQNVSITTTAEIPIIQLLTLK